MKPEQLDLEQRMEALNLPEIDRDEVRMFQEFLAVRKNRSKITPQMRDWLLGDDAAAKARGE